MLLVKTKLKISKIHGIGLFADEFIKKGTTIWRFHDGFDQKFDLKEISKLPSQARTQLFHYGYISTKSNKLILCADDARFFNHTDGTNLNTKDVDSGNEGEENLDAASRDINIGEELFCNYFEFDNDAKRKLNLIKMEK